MLRSYAVVLSQLQSSVVKGGEYDAEAFLETGELLGYRYALACGEQPNEKVAHFTLTAVPMKSTDAGYHYRAFCTDEAGIIRYDADGSGDSCIATGKPLEH